MLRKYYSNSLNANEYIASRVIVSKPCPNIILTVAPCRSGTTAHLRIFSQAGLPSYHQPLKFILRAQLEGEDIQYHIPNNKSVFIKEAIGPYTDSESTFNPVEILLKAGVPSEKIHLIIMLREPLSTITGWIQAFSFKTERDILVQNAITAYHTVQKVRKEALLLGLRTTTLVYEAFRDHDPSIVLNKLFQELELVFSSEILSGWNSLPPLKSTESNIFFPPQPELEWYSGHNIHKKIETSDSFFYNFKSPDLISQTLLPNQIAFAYKQKLFDIYEEFRIACSKQLNIDIQESKELDSLVRRYKVKHEHFGKKIEQEFT